MTSKLGGLPSNLKFQFLYEDLELDISNWTPLLIHPTEGNKLTLETKDGTYTPKTITQLVEFLTQYTTIFTYNPPGRNDILLSLLADIDLTKLYLFGKLEIQSHIIKKLKNSMVFDKTHVFNLISFTKSYLEVTTIKSLNDLAQQVINSRQETYGLFNLSSPASEARALMLQFEQVADEILLTRKLKVGNLGLFNSACYGGRMESTGIGTSHQIHYDMIKSHLRILADYPGVRDTTWIRGHQSIYFEKALPNSIYLIKTQIPKRFRFNPIPLKTESGIKYPSGEIPPNWYFKDYLLLLETLKIPYKIIDSVQFIGEPTYPFRDLTKVITSIIKLFENFYPDLEAKHLYATIAGSTKSIYRTLNRELGEDQIASRIFDPLVYGFVLSRQNTQLFIEALNTDAEAIKVDALAIPTTQPTTLPNLNLYKIKDQGTSTYLTPALKSLPNNDRPLYRNAINQCRNLDHIIIEVNMWNGLDSFLNDNPDIPTPNVPLGERFTRQITIKPSYGGNRTGKPINKVGDLLDAWFLSSPVSDSVLTNYSMLNLEEYLNRTTNL